MHKFLVVDLGMAWGHGYRLLKDGADVYLYIPAHVATPNWANDVIGQGFVPRVKEMAEVLDIVDCVLFTDIGFGATIDWLRNRGKTVWGAGFLEALEINRLYSKQVMSELNIKYPKTYAIYGIKNLIDFLKNKRGKFFVKPNYYRGDFESFPVLDPEETEVYISKLAKKLGPYQDIFEFVVEEAIEGELVGLDSWVNGNGKCVYPVFLAFERSMDAIGKFVYECVFNDVLDKLEPLFVKYGYLGNFSLEGIWDGEDLWIIDYCTRMPMTMGYIFPAFFSDYLGFVNNVCQDMVDASKYIDVTKFYGILNIMTNEVKESWLEVKYKDDAKLFYKGASRLNSRVFLLPKEDNRVCYFESGDSWDDVYTKLLANWSSNVDFQGAYIMDNKEAFVKAFSVFEDLYWG
jgi:hypothetical protein